MEFVASDVQLESHVSVGALATVVADVERVDKPLENVVEVSEMFQPAVSDPSPTSRACVWVAVWSLPLSVSVRLMLPGVVTHARAPPETETVRVVWALDPPLRLMVWPVNTFVVEVPAVSVSVSVAVKEPPVE